MIELTWISEALRWAGWLYCLLAIAALIFVLTAIKPVIGKVIGGVIVVVVFGYLPIEAAWKNKQTVDARKAAWAHFEMRCKGAGEKIYRTVDNVEGIMLLKVRPNADHKNWADPLWPGAAFAMEAGGDDYIKSFMMYEHRDPHYPDQRGDVSNIVSSRPGYRYVDILDDKENIRYRYTLSLKLDAGNSGQEKYDLRRVIDGGVAPQYGVTYEDLVDLEDRRFWVAGSIVRVIDLQTNETIGEYTRYVIDRGQGDKNQRMPWPLAMNHVCPKPDGGPGAETRFFTNKVLKPKKG